MNPVIEKGEEEELLTKASIWWMLYFGNHCLADS
jgi:hypothetical protein